MWRWCLLVVVVAGCHDRVTYAVATGARDWSAHPAVVQQAAPGAVYAVSDIHGGYRRFTTLLARNGLISAAPAIPGDVQWSGGDAVLVIVGDLIDKGADGLDVIELAQALEPQAAAAGGAVVVTLGNHEAEFFADPGNDKAEATDGIDHELGLEDVDPIAIASGADPRGRWLRERPFAARIDGWFFAHAGDSHGRDLDQLEGALRTAFDTNDFEDPEFTGAASLLEARDWYRDPVVVAAANHTLGVQHTVFGHTPDALGPRGTIAVAQAGALLRIDCGMTPDVDDSQGALLRIRRAGADEVAEQLDSQGRVTPLWRGPAQ